MMTSINYSVDKTNKRAWYLYCKLLPDDVQPTKVGENNYYEFYELTIDDDLQRRVWTKVIRETGVGGIYPTSRNVHVIAACPPGSIIERKTETGIPF